MSIMTVCLGIFSSLTKLQDKETFRRALQHTTRALTGRSDLIVSFGERSHVETNEITLPELPEKLSKKRADMYRAQADRLAFLHRYVGDGGATSFLWWLGHTRETPARVISILETARTEHKGRIEFQGTHEYLKTMAKEEVAYYSGDFADGLFIKVFALSLALREKMGEKLIRSQKIFLKDTEELFDKPLKKWLKNAVEQLENPTSRQKSYADLLDILNIHMDETSSHDEDGTKDTSDMMQMPSDKEESTAEEDKMDDSKGEDTASLADTIDSKKQDEPEALSGRPQIEQNAGLPYTVFSKRYDKVLDIAALVTKGEMNHLLERYGALLESHKHLVRRLSIQLKKHLLAPAKTGWVFDKDQGYLDGRKLSSFIAGQGEHVFQHPYVEPYTNTSVTLLVDNSGSMRGRPIEMAAISADIIATTLEQCGVKVEVLGYTTQGWKGGQCRLDWVSDGKPDHPGRLNDILHVVYKKADQPVMRHSTRFAGMLAHDILKENIDGEALLWAHSRLMKRPEDRKILMVISDGAPVDYATDRHNGTGYLDRHLREVIHDIERGGIIELCAIGIGHDVGRYYENAATIADPESLGETLVEQVVELFKK
jgi:cobaltochelatase CobT